MKNERRAKTNSFLHGREIAAARTRNCCRTNAKLFPHEHEFIFARTRNLSRTNTKWGTNCGTKLDTKCDMKCRTKLLARNSNANVSSGFCFLGTLAGGPGARKRVRGINLVAFSCGRSGRQLWGHFAPAISCGQFRVDNFARAISRSRVVLPAARACRLPPARRIACEWAAVSVAAAEVGVAVVLADALVVVSVRRRRRRRRSRRR